MAARLHINQMKDPVVAVALGFGSGLAPKAPGTAGTLIAVPLCIAMQSLSLAMYAVITAIIVVCGVFICSYATKKLGVHDHPAIVIDEVAGYLITMLAIPAGWTFLLAGFILFRIFDVIKPWPISWLDKNVTGGFGIMIDDVLAGLVSLGILHAYLLVAGN